MRCKQLCCLQQIHHQMMTLGSGMISETLLPQIEGIPAVPRDAARIDVTLLECHIHAYKVIVLSRSLYIYIYIYIYIRIIKYVSKLFSYGHFY